MSYIVITSFYEGNTLHEEGSVFEHADQAYVEKCLADGNIADSDSDVAKGTVARTQPVMDEIQAIQDADTARHEALHTGNEGGSEGATPLAESGQELETTTPAPNTVIEPVQPTSTTVEPTQTSPQVQQAPVNPSAPTPDQLAKDFEQTSSQPSTPPSDVQLQ